ncbi:MAG: TetR family transcriptional regulator [Novosphingobium sp.]|jgi:AcrR family transcriptional regulator|nr:TetR family transcriptional regulator [Novosphingobium sp.]
MSILHSGWFTVNASKYPEKAGKRPVAEHVQSPFRTALQKQEEREAKRAALLRTAVQMFNRRGFHATSLDDVAASLGVSKPTIYHYLGNKEQVLVECLTIGLDQLFTAADEVKGESGTGLERLRRFLCRYAEVIMDDFGRCVILSGDETLSPKGGRKLRAMKRQVDTALRTLIQEGIADGSIAPTDPKIMAFTLAGAVQWPARWYDPDGEIGPQDMSRRIAELLIAGLAPR